MAILKTRGGESAYSDVAGVPTRAPRSITPTRLAILAGVSAGVLTLCVTTTSAWAGATEANALITHPGTATALNGGGSSTPFGVVIPGNASCPGDTAHHGYHVFSYLVPANVPPTSVSFKTGVPSRYLGYISGGSYFGAVNTAEDTGQIMGVPSSFTWTRWTKDELLPHGARTAAWDGGVACADTHGVVTNFWNSRFRITASTSDPGGYTWRVTQTPPSPSHLGRWIGVGLILVSIIFGSLALSARRRSRETRAAGGGSAQGMGHANGPDPTSGPSGSAHARPEPEPELAPELTVGQLPS
jgi:hypothetical protein